MKKINLIVCFVLISFFVAAQSAELVYKNNVNSTVTIETEIGQGSGFFVGPNLIATNYHVIEGATEAFCYTNSSAAKYEIDGYVAVDKDVDLVILKLKGLNKPAIKMATSTPTPGQKVYVLGSPKGLEATISEGIVSGLRNWNGRKLIQISAPISHGSSGGPVLNVEGQLIGIAVGTYEDGQNINFAIPQSNLDTLLINQKSNFFSLESLAKESGNKTTIKSKSDNITFKTIKIGDQVWSAENLNTDRFANGDLIPEAKSDEEWKRAGDNGQAAWCYYENNPSYGNIYGKLYNWHAVADSRGLCPTGWHVPSDFEWSTFEDNLGGSSIAGGKIKESGDAHWIGISIPESTNSTSFTGLPGGYREINGSYLKIGYCGYWWSITSLSEENSYCRFLNGSLDAILRYDALKGNGYSVRCVKD